MTQVAPDREVLRIKPGGTTLGKSSPILAQVLMLRPYLERYCAEQECAAVSFFYGERYSSSDTEFDQLISGKNFRALERTGYLLDLRILDDEFHRECPQMARVWGTRLLLRPTGSRPTRPDDLELVQICATTTLTQGDIVEFNPCHGVPMPAETRPAHRQGSRHRGLHLPRSPPPTSPRSCGGTRTSPWRPWSG